MQIELTFEEQKQILLDYLLAKVATGDWHGVSDTANDLRVLEAQHETEKHGNRGD